MIRPRHTPAGLEASIQESAWIEAAALTGSQAQRTVSGESAADAYSDWDFLLVVTSSRPFLTPQWLGRSELYIVRTRFWKSGLCVNALQAGVAMDFIVCPAAELGAHLAAARPRFWHRRAAADALAALADVLHPSGLVMLKDRAGWEPRLQGLLRRAPAVGLADGEIDALAARFAFDLDWTRKKVARGELAAAQRMLHLHLVETNLRLFHELKRRQGHPGFARGRRLERAATEDELAQLRVSARCTEDELLAALERTRTAFLWLAQTLRGGAWQPPGPLAGKPP